MSLTRPRMKARRYFVSMLGLFLLLPSLSWAGPVWDVGNKGRVIYHQGRGDVNGFEIPISQLIFGAEDLKILGGHFAFTTGNLTGLQPGEELFGPGGHFIVRGCIDVTGASEGWCGKKDIRGTLMTGTFLNAKLIQENGQLVLVAEFLEQINPQLAAMLHEPSESDGLLELTLTGNPKLYGWTVDTVTGGSLSLLSEPSSIVTLGLGLIGLFSVLWASRIRRRTIAARFPSPN